MIRAQVGVTEEAGFLYYCTCNRQLSRYKPRHLYLHSLLFLPAISLPRNLVSGRVLVQIVLIADNIRVKLNDVTAFIHPGAAVGLLLSR